MNDTLQMAAYVPPDWAKRLNNIPRKILKLAMKPTPIHKWDIPDLPRPFTVHIKRDDLTGSLLSGNKCRKAEFSLADALEKGCDSIITCGTVWSNHCRTMAISSRQLGMNCYLVLRTPDVNQDAIAVRGNALLNRLSGAEMILVPYGSYEKEVNPKMSQLEENLRKQGKKPYIVPVGGSLYVSMFAYVSAFEEMIKQGLFENFDDIFLTSGSGGTTSGLAIANYLTGQKIKLHAVSVSFSAPYIYQHINHDLEVAGLDVKAEEIVDIIEGYKGDGHKSSKLEELEGVVKFSTDTGIICDPIYIGKTARAMVLEMKTNPSRFKGSRVLFIHTGGMFGLFAGRLDDFVKECPLTNNVYSWKDFDAKITSTNGPL